MSSNPPLTDDQTAGLRRVIGPAVAGWLRDYGLPPDKAHRQLVHRVGGAIAAMHRCGALTVGPVTSPARPRPGAAEPGR